MSLRLALAATVATVVAAPLIAQDTSPPAAPVEVKKVCRRVVPTGSIMAKKMCLTPAEWAKVDGANAQRADTFGRQRDGTIGGQAR